MCLCCVCPWSPARALLGIQRLGLVELETKRTREHQEGAIDQAIRLSFLSLRVEWQHVRIPTFEIICPRFLKWSTCRTERNPSRLPRCSHVLFRKQGNNKDNKDNKGCSRNGATQVFIFCNCKSENARKQGTFGRDVWLVDV